ncbi:hydrolase [Varunaivibrio sulfuroxidans]|uniref:Isochorismate hydrolase n=1 Tax=Varunaivibrio sulfuroxidans TaxID=1773489 RepID=A0A4R3JGA8_9PROT|nr:hydrolase [Varunaivibrio sulfuroxidans]TCS64333.1 isochorismate hydrolase [Varunaivibrio sulfuroxidans]WES31229.1 hydrolase [Varunaivibrio sulfuroxidans]
MLLDIAQSLLVVVDVQERLLPAMSAPGAVRAQLAILTRGASILGAPVLASEQYPRGIGPTVEDLRPHIPAKDIIEKNSFSCLACAPFVERLGAFDRTQVVLSGIEAHVCVLQTALDLRARDVEVFVVADATGSRTARNHRLGIARMRQAGCRIVSVEMVLFEWLRTSASEKFKQISALIK